MGKVKLAGTLIIYNGISQDYCFLEAIECLQELCDFVIVIDCGSQDGTVEDLKGIGNEKTLVIYRDKREWDIMQGRTKLAYYTNIAIDKAVEMGYEWQINLQSDEIIHETSFTAIRHAISQNNEGYYLKRINLWGNSQYQLNVPIERSPVNTAVIRLCKTKYHSIDDAESILCPANIEYVEQIRIFHVGFVRNKYKHIEKIKHIQDEVFLMNHDTRVDNMPDGFEPLSMGFTKEDLIPVAEPLPKFIQKWAKERDDINGFIL